MTNAITGATGHLGRLAIKALKARGGSAVALVRDPAKATDLGVEARAFDYTKPESMAAALQGVTALVLISSNDFNDRIGQHKAVIDAAKAAGVAHIVYTSILNAPGSDLVLAQDHKGTEAYLQATGISHTLLRNGWYTENYTGSLAGSVAHGAMAGSAGTGRISGAARADYAEAIAAVLIDPAKQGKVYELAGDSAFTMADMASVVSAKVGKTIAYHSMPMADYVKLLESFGLPADLARAVADSDDQAARGALFDDSKTLSALIGHPTTPMATTVAEAL